MGVGWRGGEGGGGFGLWDLVVEGLGFWGTGVGGEGLWELVG